MPAFVWNIQYVQPLFASSAKRSPLSLPTNNRLPRTAGCDRAELTPGNPKAHFNFRRGIIGAVRPPFSADWKRVFVAPEPPHPFQPLVRSAVVIAGALAVHVPAFDGGPAVPTGRPARNAATARRSASVNADPCRNI